MMVLPQTNGAKKPRRSPGALAGMTWFFEDTAMEATFRRVGKGMRLDATGRKGSKEIFSVHLDRVDDLVEGITEAISNPAMQAMIPALLQQVQGGMASVMRPVPTAAKVSERDKAAWRADSDARVGIMDTWAKEHGAESWDAVYTEVSQQASKAAEEARAKALAEYDAAHGTAEA